MITVKEEFEFSFRNGERYITNDNIHLLLTRELKATNLKKVENYFNDALCQYTSLGNFKEGLVRAKKNSKWGFLNLERDEVIPCIYDAVLDFHEGLAGVKKNGLWGFIDKEGTEVIPCKYKKVLDFHDGLAPIKESSAWGLINQNGEEVISCIYEEVGDCREGLIRVRKNGQYGFINKQGKVVIPFIYEDAGDFYHNCARVKEEGIWRFVDIQGRLYANKFSTAQDHMEGCAIVRGECKADYAVWRQGYLDGPIDCGRIMFVGNFHNGLARVQIKCGYSDSAVGFIDCYGNTKIHFYYDDAGDFSEGLIRVKLNGKWGFIDKEEKSVIPCIYEEASDFKEGFAYVKLDGKNHFIDKENRFLTDQMQEKKNQMITLVELFSMDNNAIASLDIQNLSVNVVTQYQKVLVVTNETGQKIIMDDQDTNDLLDTFNSCKQKELRL